MRILVIGAKGILGRAFCQISSRNHYVVALDIEEIDITRKKDAEKNITAVNPEVVVNCAGYTDVDGSESNRDRAFAVNASGVENIAAACQESGRTLVHISTDYIFDGLKGSLYTEDDPPHPINTYGESKLAGEECLRRVLPEECYLLVRSQWLYGKGGRNFVDTILAKARESTELKVVSDQFGSPTWSQDLAQAILRLVENRAHGVYHIANKGVVSWYDFARKIVEISGYHCTILSQSSRDLLRPAKRPPFSALDCSKFEKETGMVLRHWEEALREYLKILPCGHTQKVGQENSGGGVRQ